MTICKVCGKDNKADYTFCLGCGAELKGAAAAPVAPRAPSAGGAPAPGAGLGSLGLPLPSAPGLPTPPLTPAAVAASVPTSGRDDRERSLSAGWAIEPVAPAPPLLPPSAQLPGTPLFKAPIPPDPEQLPTKVGGLPAGMSGSRPIAPAPAPVPVPSRPTPAAMPSVPRPAAPLAPSPIAMPVAQSQPVAAATGEAAGTRPCPNCGSPVPAEFAFCGGCGSRVAPAAAGAAPARAPEPAPSGPPPTASQAAAAALTRGKIVLIRPDGSEGASLTLVEGENVIGRAMGPLFENDGYLSPRHAEIVINAAGCVVRDLKSLNGVYFKMQHEEPLESGDIFRLGQELLRFDLLPPAAPLDDGTEVMGSPNTGYWGRISLVIGREIDGNAWPVGGDGVTLGRERGDINFPDDGYVSGLHARLAFASGRVTLTDLHSSNGTFMRVRSQRVLENGALVQFGQQLFRLQLS